MKVPVRRQPETRVSEQQQSYARPVAPLNVSPLTEVVEGFRDQLLDEQDARQRIELNRRLLQEVNELQTDFAERRTNPEISSIDFAATTDAAYTERHTALLNGLRGEGYSQDLLDDFDGRLGTVRQGLFERGLGHQMTQLDARADEEIEEIGRQGSQYAANNPDGYATARDTLIDSVRAMPGLTEERRAALIDRELAVIQDGAGRALAMQRPQYVIDTLDPQGLTAPYRPTAPAAPSGDTGGNYTPNAGADRVMNYQARAAGFQSVPAEVQTLGQASDFAISVNRAGVPSSAMGLYQITGDTLRDFAPRVFGADWRNEAFTPAAQERIAEAIFNSARGSAAALSGRWASLTLAEAERVRQMPWAQARVEIMQGESGGSVQSAAVATPSRVGASMASGSQLAGEVTPVALPPSTAVQQSDSLIETIGPESTPDEQARAAGVPQSADISSIRTGNALLDDLNGPERLQLLGLAREQLNRVTATQRAEMDVRIGNIVAERMNGEAGTPLPSEQEVLQLYGPVEGPQRMAQLRAADAARPAIIGFRTQSATDIQAALDALEPDPGSPTYATELQVYNAAQTAAQALLTAREQDPAAYAMQHFPAVREAAGQGEAQYYAALDRAYEALGIDTDSAPVMPDEAIERLTGQYRDMSATQRREFLRRNFAQMGEDRFRRFARGAPGTTMESDANIFALMRTYPGQGWGNVYNEVLEGRQIIAQDPARRPNPAQVRARFRTSALSGIGRLDANTSRAIQEAAEGLYVQWNGDPTELDNVIYDRALAAALGGSLPVDMRTSSRVPFTTILPPRVNRQRFEGWIERQTIDSLTRSSVGRRPPRYQDVRTAASITDIINEGTFVMVAPGQYMIYMGSDGRPLGTSNAQPFIVNIDPREVVRSSGAVRGTTRVYRPSEPMRGGVM